MTLSIDIQIDSIECHYAECCYAEYHYAVCRKAECHYAECRSAQKRLKFLIFEIF
jgi:hypothetical protein